MKNTRLPIEIEEENEFVAKCQALASWAGRDNIIDTRHRGDKPEDTISRMVARMNPAPLTLPELVELFTPEPDKVESEPYQKDVLALTAEQVAEPPKKKSHHAKAGK